MYLEPREREKRGSARDVARTCLRAPRSGNENLGNCYAQWEVLKGWEHGSVCDLI